MAQDFQPKRVNPVSLSPTTADTPGYDYQKPDNRTANASYKDFGSGSLCQDGQSASIRSANVSFAFKIPSPAGRVA